MKILVTGGCGYKGHVLIPKLLTRGDEVIAFDIQWFGNYLAPHPNLTVIKGDVRDIDSIPLAGRFTIKDYQRQRHHDSSCMETSC